MLRIYPVILDVLRQLRPVLRRIELKDRDLARQLRRCSVEVSHPRWRGACALSRSSAACRALEETARNNHAERLTMLGRVPAA
jgi:hypothetical protein